MNVTTQQLLNEFIIEPAGWMLVHSLWQLACLAGVLAVLVRLTQRCSAELRYHISSTILAAMVALPIATYWLAMPAGTTPPPQVSKVTETYVASPDEPQQSSEQLLAVELGTDSTLIVNPDSIVPGPQELGGALPGWRKTMRAVFSWLVAMWGVGVALLSVWNIGGWIAVQRLVRLGIRPIEPELHNVVRQLAKELRIKRVVTVIESTVVEIPSVVGWLQPTVLIPGAVITGLTPRQLEAILAHELAHIRRGDYLANLLQTVAETLLFYHPGIWYASARMRIEREYCADRMAASICGRDTEYASALATLEERAATLSPLALAATGGSLTSRIRRILGLSTNDAGRTGSWLAGAALSVAVLVVLAGAPAVRARALINSAPNVEIARIWADAQTHSSGSISPDGRYLSFINSDNGNLAVCDLHDENRTTRDLTTEGTWDLPNKSAESPVWSPDSRRIGYTWFVDERPPQIRVVSVDGGEPQTLFAAEEGGFVYTETWSPAGRHILAHERTGAGEGRTVLIDVHSGTPEALPNMPVNRGHAAFSPDGRLLAYPERTFGDQRDIFLYELATGEISPAVEHTANDHSPIWSPDGQWLTFLSTRGGSAAAWMLPVRGGRPSGRPIPLSPLSVPEGRVLGMTDQGAYLLGTRPSGLNAFVIDYDPQRNRVRGQPRLLVDFPEGGNLKPTWSDDGKRLAYFSRRAAPQGGKRFYPIVRDEQLQRETLLDPSLRVNLAMSEFAWLPGGNALLLSAVHWGGDYQAILRWVRCDVESGEITTLRRESATSGGPPLHMSTTLAVDPAGHSLYYIVWKNGHSHVVRRLLASGAEEEVVEIDDASLNRLAISSDGAKLAVQGTGSLYVVDIAFKASRLAFGIEDASLSIPNGISWTADSKRIVFAIQNTNRAGLWSIAAAANEPQPLGLEMPAMFGVRVHPDGDTLAFTGRQSAHHSAVWAIKNSLLMTE